MVVLRNGFLLFAIVIFLNACHEVIFCVGTIWKSDILPQRTEGRGQSIRLPVCLEMQLQ